LPWTKDGVAYLEPPLAKRSEESMMINDSSKVRDEGMKGSSMRSELLVCRGVLFTNVIAANEYGKGCLLSAVLFASHRYFNPTLSERPYPDYYGEEREKK